MVPFLLSIPNTTWKDRNGCWKKLCSVSQVQIRGSRDCGPSCGLIVQTCGTVGGTNPPLPLHLHIQGYMKQKYIELGGNSSSQCTLHVPVVETDPQYLWSETRSPFESEYNNCGAFGQQTHNAPSHSQSQNKSKVRRPKTGKKLLNSQKIEYLATNLMLQNIQRDRSSVSSFL